MKKSYLSRRESIILSALEIIDELGLCGLSTREIARRQDISDAALYKHFKSKEEIILAVLDYFSNFDSVIMKTVENNNLKPCEGILFFIGKLAEYYENYPPISAVLSSFECLIYDISAQDRLKEIMDKRFDFIRSLVIEGKNTGEIGSGYDTEDLADTIMGITRTIVFKWRLNSYNFALEERIISATSTLLEAARAI